MSNSNPREFSAVRVDPKTRASQLQRSPQRKSENAAAVTPSLADAVRSPGQPLPSELRTTLEPRFGHDFSRVRIHADGAAASAAHELSALAFTIGSDVVFGRGQYAPDTDAGLRLLGHELTHVVQQSGVAPSAIQRAIDAPKKPASKGEAEVEKPQVDTEMVDLQSTAAVPKEVPSAPTDQPDEATAAGTIAAQLDGSSTMPLGELVVAPGDASEREADTMSDWIATRNPLRSRPPINRYSMPRTPARKPKPPAPVAEGPPRQRLNLVFIMGADKKGNANKFYTAAHAYFETKVPNDALIDDADHRNLLSVFQYLNTLNPRQVAVGNLYLVSHANEMGMLSFPLTSSDEDKKLGTTSFPQLKNALDNKGQLFQLPAGLIDQSTVIHIKGCNIGRSTAMLDQVDRAFGGEAQVTAPTHKQKYTYTKSKGKITDATEALSVYYLEFEGLKKLSSAEQLDQFSSKYSYLSAKKWKTLLGGGATRKVLTPLTFAFTAPAGSEQDAIAEAKLWGDPQLTRPESYLWRVASKAPQKDGRILYKLEANKTNYTVDRVLTDEEGKTLVPDESNPLFFGKSDYEGAVQPPTVSVAPTGMSPSELFREIADVSKRIAALAQDDNVAKANLVADWNALEDELRQRAAKLTPAELIGALGQLAQAMAPLSQGNAQIRTDLLTAGGTLGDELVARPAGMGGSEVTRLIATLNAATSEASGGDAQVLALFKAALDACDRALQQRLIKIDVNVIKTEDWLGADEVYAQLSNGRYTGVTSEVKLNDGEAFSFSLKAAPFLPLNGPLSLQVFDADWPDRDDLIVKFDWKQPFTLTANSESLDKADYRVKIHFDR